jgi:GMP synthase-like glutamine amidotransferase
VKALLLEHADHEGAGLLNDALVVRRAVVDRRRLHRGEALPDNTDGYDLVIGMGGAMDAWDDQRHPWLAGEARLLAEAARAGRVTLGVCLGAQLLARGLGARVYRGTGLEIGMAPLTLSDDGRADVLLKPFDGQPVLHWHRDTFDLPEGAVRLASTAAYANQAYRVGSRAYGVQFHVECDQPMRARWAKMAERELREHGVNPTSLAAAETRLVDERGREFAARLVSLVA